MKTIHIRAQICALLIAHIPVFSVSHAQTTTDEARANLERITQIYKETIDELQEKPELVALSTLNKEEMEKLAASELVTQLKLPDETALRLGKKIVRNSISMLFKSIPGDFPDIFAYYANLYSRFKVDSVEPILKSHDLNIQKAVQYHQKYFKKSLENLHTVTTSDLSSESGGRLLGQNDGICLERTIQTRLPQLKRQITMNFKIMASAGPFIKTFNSKIFGADNILYLNLSSFNHLEKIPAKKMALLKQSVIVHELLHFQQNSNLVIIETKNLQNGRAEKIKKKLKKQNSKKVKEYLTSPAYKKYANSLSNDSIRTERKQKIANEYSERNLTAELYMLSEAEKPAFRGQLEFLQEYLGRDQGLIGFVQVNSPNITGLENIPPMDFYFDIAKKFDLELELGRKINSYLKTQFQLKAPRAHLGFWAERTRLILLKLKMTFEQFVSKYIKPILNEEKNEDLDFYNAKKHKLFQYYFNRALEKNGSPELFRLKIEKIKKG